MTNDIRSEGRDRLMCSPPCRALLRTGRPDWLGSSYTEAMPCATGLANPTTVVMRGQPLGLDERRHCHLVDDLL